MDKIEILYEDVADYYTYLISGGATEFTKAFNSLKYDGISHTLSIQLINLILDYKYNKPTKLQQFDLDQLRHDLLEEKQHHEIKIIIFKYYVQMLNSFKDEPSSIKAIAKNTGLSTTTIINFLKEYNKRLDLKFQDNELEKNIRTIFSKIWGD
ncbi:MAG: hypothetical protein KBD37_05225 [Burkholderiales bacterium]|nr:hypothetical protein [Burkholderiales bacterium]